MSILTLENIAYSYDKGKTFVFRDLNLSFEKGKLYAITGSPGCGKTTLMALIAGLDKVTEGKICFDGKDISTIDTYNFRSKDIGVILRNYNLLPHLTAVENVIFSMNIAGMNSPDLKDKAMNLLKMTGVPEDVLKDKVSELETVHQLKVAIARAISYDPQILIADEPTKKFSYKDEEEIIGILRNLVRDNNMCVIVTTQSIDIKDSADVVYEIKSADQEDDFVKDKFVKFYNFD